MARKQRIIFRTSSAASMFTIALPARKKPKKQRVVQEEDRPLPKPTHYVPCSVDKVELMAKRYERGEALHHPEDFTPTDPVMIQRYVFSGRKASKLGTLAARFVVPELLPSSPRIRHE